jgi:hypothetical protein
MFFDPEGIPPLRSVVPHHAALGKVESAMPPVALFLLSGEASRRAARRPRPESAVLGSADDALDVDDGNPIDLRHLGNRHALSRQGPDARKLRARNLTRRRRGRDLTFGLIVTCRRRRGYSQHTRLARRLVGWRGVWN